MPLSFPTDVRVDDLFALPEGGRLGLRRVTKVANGRATLACEIRGLGARLLELDIAQLLRRGVRRHADKPQATQHVADRLRFTRGDL